ncbi:MAG: M4 family metallopeptidase [Acidobacteriota bacterium]
MPTIPQARYTSCCFLPPHLLRAIAERGSPAQREAASRTLAVDLTFRSLRWTGAARLAHVAPPVAAPACERRVFTAGGSQDLPGQLARREGAPPTVDVAVNEAFDALGATYDFFLQVHQRHSIDDEGLPLDATVHFGQRYDNAFWNGQQMVFGDGDGEIFNRFTIALDVIGHELTHGVTEDESRLAYLFQPGALNESISDVFGSLVRQYALGQTAREADWLIGAGLFTSAVNGAALRSMKDPGTAYDDPVLGRDPQPAHMNDFVRTYDDNGGVHINSGIPNRAFYLSAIALGGHAWDRAGRIWYEALRDPQLRSNAGFARFAKLTVGCAARLYGPGSVEEEAVGDAWRQVGVQGAARAIAA